MKEFISNHKKLIVGIMIIAMGLSAGIQGYLHEKLNSTQSPLIPIQLGVFFVIFLFLYRDQFR